MKKADCASSPDGEIKEKEAQRHQQFGAHPINLPPVGRALRGREAINQSGDLGQCSGRPFSSSIHTGAPDIRFFHLRCCRPACACVAFFRCETIWMGRPSGYTYTRNVGCSKIVGQRRVARSPVDENISAICDYIQASPDGVAPTLQDARCSTTAPSRRPNYV